MRSPICHLEKQIAGAPFNIAPEKASLCMEHRDRLRITFAIVDEQRFGIRVRLNEDTNDPEVVLPVAALEYLWAFSHYCWVLIQEYKSAQQLGSPDFDCVGNPRLKESFLILDWAKSNLSSSGTTPWPQQGPRPSQSPVLNSDEHVATELFLCALAWILHHELAHIVLNHPLINTPLSEQEEREADRFATEWLLGGLPENDPKIKKRALGLAVAVLCLQSLEIDSTPCLRNTHPAAHNRIFENTALYQCGNDEVIEATCAVVLQYLLHETGITANIDGNTFSDILGDLLCDISREKGS